jgi:hypothetical protein
MNLTSAKATFGLNVKATPTSSNVIGTVQIGASNTGVSFPDANVAYSVMAVFAGTGDGFTIFPSSGATTGSTAFVAGAAQVETATAAGTVTTGGNAEVVVTATGMTGSPKTYAVAVATSDTPTFWAAKVRTALNADTAFTALYTASGSGTAIVATRKPTATFTVPGGTLNLFAANDSSLNIALATGTASGITTAGTSSNTTVGVVSDGVKIYDDATDFEGIALDTMATVNGILIEHFGGGGSAIGAVGTGTDIFTMKSGEVMLRSNLLGVDTETAYTFTPSTWASTYMKITVIGKTA